MLIRPAMLLIFAVILPLSSPVLAFDFTVTPGAGTCDPQGDCDPAANCTTCQNPISPATPCGFQEALNIAQCNQEDDTLNLAAGNYDASAVSTAENFCPFPGFCYVGNRAQAENRSLTILGAGAGQTVIDGNSQTPVMGLRITSLGPNDLNVSLTIRGITIQDNILNSFGAGLIVGVVDADTRIEECEFLRNDSAGGGGGAGMSASGGGSFFLNRNAFFDNIAFGGGGGAFLAVVDGSIDLTNNILAGNRVTTGGNGAGAYLESFDVGSIRVVNNTFFNNQNEGQGSGGGLGIGLCDASNADVYNNIVYGNSANSGLGNDIFAGAGSSCMVAPVGTLNLFNNDFSDFGRDASSFTVNGFPGATNLDQDPLWVDSGNDDFHLTALSPVIDMGDLNPPLGLPSPDFDGVTRPQGPLPDMGALEVPMTPSPTPSASPTPTATPIPPTPNTLLFGSGCSLGSGGESLSFLRIIFLAPLAIVLRKFFRPS